MGYINIYAYIIHEKLSDFYIYNIWIYRRANGIYIALQFAAYGKFFLIFTSYCLYRGKKKSKLFFCFGVPKVLRERVTLNCLFFFVICNNK